MAISESSPAPGSTLIRVLTLNTHKGFTAFNRRFVLHELREAVRRVGADVVFLQEVQGAHASRASRVRGWPAAPHYEYLADELWPQYAYGRNAVYPDGDHGNAVLSKFPIESHRNHDVSVDGQEARGLLHCVLQLPDSGQLLHVICVHLGLREAHRHAQLQLLRDVIEKQVPAAATLVVAGDFNDWRNRAHRVLTRCEGLHDVFAQSRGRSARSFPARWPLLRLDRIYVRNAASATPMLLPAHPWSRLSDHVPLAAEVML